MRERCLIGSDRAWKDGGERNEDPVEARMYSGSRPYISVLKIAASCMPVDKDHSSTSRGSQTSTSPHREALPMDYLSCNVTVRLRALDLKEVVGNNFVYARRVVVSMLVRPTITADRQ